MECTKVNCPMQAGTPTDNCGKNCPWRTTAKTGDLISRAVAIDYLMTNMRWCDEDGYTVDDADEKRTIITDLVEGIPAVDAVPVVRCQYCKYSIDNVDHPDKACEVSFGLGPYGYCSAGERRE